MCICRECVRQPGLGSPPLWVGCPSALGGWYLRKQCPSKRSSEARGAQREPAAECAAKGLLNRRGGGSLASLKYASSPALSASNRFKSRLFLLGIIHLSRPNLF